MATAAAISQTDDRRFRDWFLWFPVNWNWFVVAKVQNSQHHQYITHTHTFAGTGKASCAAQTAHTQFLRIMPIVGLQIMSVNYVLIIFSLCGGVRVSVFMNIVSLIYWFWCCFFLIFARSPSINAFSRHSFCGLYRRLWAVVTYIESQVKKEQHRTGENVIW